MGFGSIEKEAISPVLTGFLGGGILWLVLQNVMRRTILVVGERLKTLFEPSAVETLRQGGIEFEEIDNPQSVKLFLSHRDDALVIAENSKVVHALRQELATIHRHFLKVYRSRTLMQVLKENPDRLREFLTSKEIDLLRMFLRSPGRMSHTWASSFPEASAIESLQKTVLQSPPGKNPDSDRKKGSESETSSEVNMILPSPSEKKFMKNFFLSMFRLNETTVIDKKTGEVVGRIPADFSWRGVKSYCVARSRMLWNLLKSMPRIHETTIFDRDTGKIIERISHG